ncbi:MAG: sugar ABC transporter permease [Phycisphaerales bacterium]|nr:sugar ABC transporter permease [Phycisphaerales bacterium]
MARPSSTSAYAFLAFPLGVLIVFTLVPTMLGLGLSLFTWDGVGRASFAGLENFRALARDPRFGPALRNTLVFVVASVPPTVLIGFLVAAAMHARWFIGRSIARTMVFIPTVVSIVAIGFVWRWMLDDGGGLVPAMLRTLGFTDLPNFLQDGSWPMVSIIVVSIWRGIGLAAVLYLAALSNLGEGFDEAAACDGASRAQVLRHITWPLVGPTTVFLLITGAISALQVFDIVWAMTAGVENDATTVLNLYVFREFQQSRLGYASAIAVLIFVLTMLASAPAMTGRRARA